MNLFKLLLRNLRYFARADVATAAGMAVATAVLTGALMVGDSVRGSLRDIVTDRLGRVDHAVASPIYFADTLADRLAGQAGFGDDFDSAVVGVTVTGGAVNRAGPEPARSADVQIVGLSGWVAVAPGACVLNGKLADELGVAEGGRVELNLPAVGNLPIDATLARRGRADVLGEAMQLTVARVVRGYGFESGFSLTGGQRLGRLCWVNPGDLQRAIDQPGRANLLLVDAKPPAEGGAGARRLNDLLAGAAGLGDFGLHIDAVGDGRVSLRSRNTYLSKQAEAAADAAAESLNIRPGKVTIYLANRVEPAGGGRAIHYAVVAGLSDPPGGSLADDEVAINQWTADQLGLAVGDRLRITYYDRRPDGELVEVSSDAADGSPAPAGFRVARIVPTAGPGADATLTPSFEGLTDKDSVADWDPPAGVTIDRGLVTAADEAYWDEHRAAPKLFVSLSAARAMWADIFGDLTGYRVPAERRDAFAAALAEQLRPMDMGIVARPIRREQLAAASGSTDFAELFVGFSFFLIAAAVLLTALLFRLAVEQRARQLGLMGAVGFSRGRIRRLAVGEGAILAATGSAVGVAAAVGYGWAMVAALRTWWVDAVGTSALHLHVRPATLGMGLASGVIIALLAVVWAVWRIGRERPAALLAGRFGRDVAHHRGGVVLLLMAAGLLAGGAGLLAFGFIDDTQRLAGFLGGGAVVLAAILTGLVGVWRRGGGRGRPARSIGRLAVRNAARHPARSSLAVGLLAFATFVLVVVAAMRQGAPTDTHERTSGAGGYTLVLESDIPLTGNLATRAGRDLLGVRDAADPAWDGLTFASLRRARGQDVSCLNLMAPTRPTILGVGDAMIDRGGFTFARTTAAADNPWTLLRDDAGGPDVVPVIADDETARYILKKSPGDEIVIHDDLGQPRRLRLVATLHASIFQGELLMSRANFERLFPGRDGFGVVLIDAPPAEAAAWRGRLANEFADFSAAVEPTADRLMAFRRVANTYLSTFQALGALGLVLGTIGLAVVLLRSLVERRAELALLGAIGFGRGARLGLVLAENAWLLALGLAAGLAASLAGVVPLVASGERSINAGSLAGTLVGVFLFGLAVLASATWLAGRKFTPADLRRE